MMTAEFCRIDKNVLAKAAGQLSVCCVAAAVL